MSGESGSVNVINLKFSLDNSSAPQTSRTLSDSSQEDENFVAEQSLETKLIGMLGDVQRQLSRLEKKIDHNDHQVEIMARNMENRDKRIEDKMKGNATDFTAKLENVLSQVEVRNSQEELQQKYNHLQDTLRQVREKLNKKDERIRELLKESNEGKKKTDELTAIIEKCRAEIEDKNKIIEEKNRMLEIMKKQSEENIQKYENEVKILKNEIKREESKLLHYEKKQQEMDDEIRQKNKDIQELEKEKVALEVENKLKREEAEKMMYAVKEIAETKGENASDFVRTDTSFENKLAQNNAFLEVRDNLVKHTAKSAPVKIREPSSTGNEYMRSTSNGPSKPEMAFVGTKSISSSQHKDFKTSPNINIVKARKTITEKTGEKNKFPRK